MPTLMTKRREAIHAFSTRALGIIDTFKDIPKKSPSPFESRWGFFKREAYRLIRSTKGSQGGHQIIKAIVKTEDCEPVRLYYKGNEFHWGLVAMDPHQEILTPKKVSLLARQLTYADLHDVPSHYLVGFLYQCGPSVGIAKKLEARTREPWMMT